MSAKQVAMRIGVAVATIAVLLMLLAWWPRSSGEAATNGDTWTCSMHPQIRLPSPGNCPICGMDLIPISKLPKARNDLERRAGLVTEPIQRRELFKEIRTVGKLDYSERQVAYLTARIAGRVDRVFADFTGIQVKKEDHLVEIYSPELNVTQNELLLAREAAEKEKANSPSVKGFAASRLEAARTKLRLLGILDEQIAELEQTKLPHTHLTIFSPIGGTVIEKNVRAGQYVNTGDPLFRIADLDPIWLYLNVYEFDIAWVRIGQSVEVALEAFPGETFSGSIMFVDPFLDDATRTIRVRVNIKNPERRLKPQMFATGTIHVKLRGDGSPEPTGLEGKYVCPMHPEVVRDDAGKCSICEMPLEKVPLSKETQKRDEKATPHAGHERHLVAQTGTLAIPVSAVLDTGRRRIAYRLNKEGAYELMELKLGPRAHAMDESGRRREFFVVLDGLNTDDRVVTQSGFLLDSQRQIEGMPSLIYPAGQIGTSLHSGHAQATPPSAKEKLNGHQH